MRSPHYVNKKKKKKKKITPVNMRLTLKAKEKRKERVALNSHANQQKRMEELYQKLHLTTVGEWLNVSPSLFAHCGGAKLFRKHRNQLQLLLSSLYPHYPWAFEKQKVYTGAAPPNIATVQLQRDYIEELFQQLQLESLEDWTKVSRYQLTVNGGRGILKHYNNSMIALFSALYPNYPWGLHYTCSHLHSSKEAHQMQMERVYEQMQFTSLDDWLLSPRPPALSNSGDYLLLLSLYHCHLPLLLTSLYPYYPWDFSSLGPSTRSKFSSMEAQREFMEGLYHRLDMQSLDDWGKITINKITLNGGGSLLAKYQNHLPSLLSSTFPFYPWHSLSYPTRNKSSLPPIRSFKTIEKQRERMDQLFYLFNLTTLEDWCSINQKKLHYNGGLYLLQHYHNDLATLYRSIYPYYPWNFATVNTRKKNYFQSMGNQRLFMDHLYAKFQLKSMEEWKRIVRNKILINGGSRLLKAYNNNLITLLSNVYPHYPWSSPRKRMPPRKPPLPLIESHLKKMEKLFEKNKLTYIDDWKYISRSKFTASGGGRLLALYNDDMLILLPSLYPNYPWEFEECHSLQAMLLKEMHRYLVRRKKDWYRLPLHFGAKFDLPRSLQLLYPEERWSARQFQLRSKKSSQRLLFACTQRIYPSLLILENYLHPLLRHADTHYELDLFIPSLHLALEYQGEQHYDDIPAAFAGIELNQSRDGLKDILSSDLHLRIIKIPYWWDQTLASLRPVIMYKDL